MVYSISIKKLMYINIMEWNRNYTRKFLIENYLFKNFKICSHITFNVEQSFLLISSIIFYSEQFLSSFFIFVSYYRVGGLRTLRLSVLNLHSKSFFNHIPSINLAMCLTFFNVKLLNFSICHPSTPVLRLRSSFQTFVITSGINNFFFSVLLEVWP